MWVQLGFTAAIVGMVLTGFSGWAIFFAVCLVLSMGG